MRMFLRTLLPAHFAGTLCKDIKKENSGNLVEEPLYLID